MDFWSSILFYKWQFLQALLLACLLAPVGVVLIMRSEALSGWLIAQAVIVGHIIFLGVGSAEHNFPGAASSVLAALFAYGLVVPFYMLARPHKQAATILLVAILVCMALAELLAALGHVRMHLLQIYHGEILTGEVSQVWPTIVIMLLLLGCWLYFRDPLLLATVDRQQARVMGLGLLQMDLIYLAVLVVVYSWAIAAAGSIFSLAYSIGPALVVMAWSRSPGQAMLLAALLAALATVTGFGISLMPWQTGQQTIHLPTSSSMVLLLALLSGLLWLGRALLHRLRG